ncbi:HTH-type transcriptional regulator CysL [Aquimixticola soesokkakensis]|uniref:HTH-type transcriptional regulator CysL n=1 Tax=Aquimixticola soesokkakensis TaxID=1519096 RepID=A0A1Y5RWH1_9RHOB|nr:LysR family transcriptional regulator [Aquimixticola soesokkakensis]SLN27112.1 HTH-type transcriptional regulator CysL [Aquimixticola soesokkakensis]
MLNATWLDTFATLCDVGHFTRAGAMLNMTQPGVSQHIQKLEAQVGQALLARDGKSFTLTPVGEDVLAIARRRRAEDIALHQSLGFDDPSQGEVCVACSGSLALLLYPRFMELMAQAPKLGLMVQARPQAGIIEGVLNGEVDLGILSAAPTHPRLEGVKAGQDELCLLLPLGHPLPKRLSDLQDLGFIAHPDGYAQADALLGVNFPDDYCGAGTLTRRSFINQIGQIPEPVVRGLGYTILPRSGVDAFRDRDRLSIAPLAQRVQHDLWLIQRRKRVLSARLRAIRDEIITCLKSL